MVDYVKAFENEIAVEGFIQDIGSKAMKIIKFIGDLIKRAISFLVSHVQKLAKNKKTNMDPTPNSQAGAGAEVMQNNNSKEEMQNTISKTVYAEDLYNCGKELNDVIADIQFCIELLSKRPAPDHKIGKGYAERWNGDNELIAERMARCMDVIEKLEDIEKKTVSAEMGQQLKNKLEMLDKQYQKYARIYQMFIKKNSHTEQYMISTMNSFNQISNVAGKALNIILQLYTSAE